MSFDFVLSRRGHVALYCRLKSFYTTIFHFQNHLQFFRSLPISCYAIMFAHRRRMGVKQTYLCRTNPFRSTTLSNPSHCPVRCYDLLGTKLCKALAVEFKQYDCAVCDVACRDNASLLIHNESPRHIRRTEGRNCLYVCEPYGGVKFTFPSDWKQHTESRIHIENTPDLGSVESRLSSRDCTVFQCEP